jgi:hypothetical protein
MKTMLGLSAANDGPQQSSNSGQKNQRQKNKKQCFMVVELPCNRKHRFMRAFRPNFGICFRCRAI